jgi:hypothetical protein
LRAELRSGHSIIAILDLEYRLVGGDKRRLRTAFAILEAFLVNGEIELRLQRSHLLNVVLQCHRQADAVRHARQPAVIGYLVVGRKREAGAVRIAIYVVPLDRIVALALTGLRAGGHDVLQRAVVRAAGRDVQPVFTGPPIRASKQAGWEAPSVGPPVLVGPAIHVADRFDAVAMKRGHGRCGVVESVDVVCLDGFEAAQVRCCSNFPEPCRARSRLPNSTWNRSISRNWSVRRGTC